MGIVYCHLSKKGRQGKKAYCSNCVKGSMKENRLGAGSPVRRLVVRPGENLNQKCSSRKNDKRI